MFKKEWAKVSINPTSEYISFIGIEHKYKDRINELKIKNEIHKLRAFADNLVLIVDDPWKGTEVLMKKLKEFSILAGFKINKQK